MLSSHIPFSFTAKTKTMKTIHVLTLLLLCSLFSQAQVTSYPTYYTNIEEMKITSIEIKSNKTVVNYSYQPVSSHDMYIHKGTYIQKAGSSTGRKYYITKFRNNQLNKVYKVEKGKRYTIILEFQKIPSYWTRIDIKEPANADGWTPWYWNNITLRSNERNNLTSKSGPISYTFLANGKYGYQTLGGKQSSYWKCYVPANKMAVFTLKNKSRVSDFDLFVYSDKSKNYKLGSGRNRGTTSELVSLNPSNSGKYVYIQVFNDGSPSSEYNLHVHHVDLVDIATQAFVDASAQYLVEEGLKWLFDIDDSNRNHDESSRNISRASSLIISALKNENLGGASKNLIINEITMGLREEFGYGFWGNLLVNYAISVVDKTYAYYY